MDAQRDASSSEARSIKQGVPQHLGVPLHCLPEGNHLPLSGASQDAHTEMLPMVLVQLGEEDMRQENVLFNFQHPKGWNFDMQPDARE